MKKTVIAFILGLIVMGTITTVAYSYSAKDISYTPSNTNWKVSNIGDAIDSLKTDGAKKFCELKSGNALEVGSMYECDPGDNVKRNFYVLKTHLDTVDLIMDRNITQGTSDKTLTWNNAMKYIKNNNLETTWRNVISIDLPKAQDIADAVGNSSWKAVDSGSVWWCFASKAQDYQVGPYCNTSQAQAYNWLYDYTRDCNGCSHSLSSGEAYGYWTRDLISNNSVAWEVAMRGSLSRSEISDATSDGVRPVITILKSNIK